MKPETWFSFNTKKFLFKPFSHLYKIWHLLLHLWTQDLFSIMCFNISCLGSKGFNYSPRPAVVLRESCVWQIVLWTCLRPAGSNNCSKCRVIPIYSLSSCTAGLAKYETIKTTGNYQNMMIPWLKKSSLLNIWLIKRFDKKWSNLKGL